MTRTTESTVARRDGTPGGTDPGPKPRARLWHRAFSIPDKNLWYPESHQGAA